MDKTTPSDGVVMRSSRVGRAKMFFCYKKGFLFICKNGYKSFVPFFAFFPLRGVSGVFKENKFFTRSLQNIVPFYGKFDRAVIIVSSQ